VSDAHDAGRIAPGLRSARVHRKALQDEVSMATGTLKQASQFKPE